MQQLLKIGTTPRVFMYAFFRICVRHGGKEGRSFLGLGYWYSAAALAWAIGLAPLPTPLQLSLHPSSLSILPSLCLLQRSPGTFCQHFPIKHPTQGWKHPKAWSGHHPSSTSSCVGLNGVWASPLPQPSSPRQQHIRVISELRRKLLQKPHPIQILGSTERSLQTPLEAFPRYCVPIFCDRKVYVLRVCESFVLDGG